MSTPTVPQAIASTQANKETPLQEDIRATCHQSVYAYREATSAGLTFGYHGGRWGGFSVAAGTLALTGSATNYIVVLRSSGVPSVGTSSTNWNDSTNYARVYRVTTDGSGITNIYGSDFDYRAGPGGVHGSAGSPSGTAGKHAIYIAAGSITPSASGGCASLATIASAANQPDIQTLDFDATTQEYAQFGIVMPKSWNEGTITFKAHWSHASTTTNFGVVWDLQAVAVGDDDAIAAAFGTAQTSSDTGGTTNDLYNSPESSAITVAGSPGAEEMVFFRLSRVTGDGGDTMAIDARLHGVTVYITTDADTDA